jgi:hypothetical protein
VGDSSSSREAGIGKTRLLAEARAIPGSTGMRGTPPWALHWDRSRALRHAQERSIEAGSLTCMTTSTDWPRNDPAKGRETSGNEGVLKRRNRLLNEPFQRVLARSQTGLHRIPKPRVAGSIPAGGTTQSPRSAAIQARLNQGSEWQKADGSRMGPVADASPSRSLGLILDREASDVSRPLVACRTHVLNSILMYRDGKRKPPTPKNPSSGTRR